MATYDEPIPNTKETFVSLGYERMPLRSLTQATRAGLIRDTKAGWRLTGPGKKAILS
jgi:hypothetical protein